MRKYILLLAILMMVPIVNAAYTYPSSTDSRYANFSFYAKDTFWHANITTLPVKSDSATIMAKFLSDAQIYNPTKAAYIYVTAPMRLNIVDNTVSPKHYVSAWENNPYNYIRDDIEYPFTNETVSSCQNVNQITDTSGTPATNPNYGRTYCMYYDATGVHYVEQTMWILNPGNKSYDELYRGYNLTTRWGDGVLQYKAQQARHYVDSDTTLRTGGTNSLANIPYTPAILTKKDLTQSKEIDHVLLMYVSWTKSGQPRIWPSLGTGTCPGYAYCPSDAIGQGSAPTGTWLRLKWNDTKINSYTPNQYKRKVLRAMRNHGILVMDNGGGSQGEFGVIAEYNLRDLYSTGDGLVGRWVDYYRSNFPTDSTSVNDYDLNSTAFEVVDASYMKIGDYSMKIKSQYADTGNETPIIPPDPPYTDPWKDYVPPNMAGEAPLSINFTDISYDNPDNVTYWIWAYNNTDTDAVWTDFSYDENNTYVFTNAGDYLIRLTAGNDFGENVSPLLTWVNVTTTSTTASFTKTKTVVRIPALITFNSTSTNATYFNWSLADGTYATTENVTHRYTRPGSFNVSLTTTNTEGLGSSVAYAIVKVVRGGVSYEFFPGESNERLMVNCDEFTYTSSRELSDNEREITDNIIGELCI